MNLDADIVADLCEAVEERAAWFECEADLPRDLAEDLALLNLCSRLGLGCPAGEAPFHLLAERTAPALVDGTDQFRRDSRQGVGGDFLSWLAAMPHVAPPTLVGPPPVLPPGWQTDPLWWEQLACGCGLQASVGVEA